MIVLDVNILLYAYDSASAMHNQARQWTEHTFSNAALVGIPWQTINAFLRLTTNARLPGQRFSLGEASDIVDQWLTRPNIRPLSPGDEHWTIFRRVAEDGQARGPLISDAHLAALTLEYGGVLYTTDRDFARFASLRWMNPLQ